MFKVKFTSGTGREGDVGDFTVIGFRTEAERDAFMKGVSMTSAALDNSVDAWVDVQDIDN